MGDHPNVAKYKEAYEAFSNGDRDAFGRMLTDDVVWHTIGGETMHGAEAVASSMSGLENVDFELDLHDAVGNDEHVIGLVEAKVKVGDREFSYRTAEIHHVDADGRVTERWAFSDDTAAITDFFNSLG